jgi:hypothetical protein
MIYKFSPKNDSPRKAAGQAAKKIPLCAKKSAAADSQRRGVAKVKTPLRLCCSAPLREQIRRGGLAKKGSRQGQDSDPS